ncbi:MAG TPA: MFS transporter [Phototrophicaceae bacterium]|jgi:DHA1 family tetracycline resistance protein-like MFS transporter|nr:MFS transporter [Phototrophicaceae bacterium]
MSQTQTQSQPQPQTYSVTQLSPAALKRALGLIFFIMMMDVMGLGILAPVTPFIVGKYSTDAIMITLTTALYAAAQFFAAPLFGKLGDRYGRRPVLLLSVLGSSIGYLIFGIGGALWVLLLSRLIDGFTGGNMSTASAYIADVSRPEERAKNFTLIGMAYGLGFILGPALGGLFSRISLEAPIFAAAGLSLLSFLLGLFILPESLPPARRETASIRPGDLNPFGSIGMIARKPGLGRFLMVLCLFEFAFNGINSITALFVAEKFAVEAWQIGLMMVVVGIAMAVVQAVIIPRIVPRYGEKAVAMIGLLGQAVGAVAMFLAPSFWLLFPVAMFTSAMSGFMFASLGAFGANQVSDREQGVLAGVTTALGSFMSIFGPLWAGLVYDRVMPSSPYWMGALVFIMATLVMMQVKAAQATAGKEAWSAH